MRHVADWMTRRRQAGSQFRIGLLAGGNLLLVALDGASQFDFRPNESIIVHPRTASAAQQVDIRAHRRPIGRIARRSQALGPQRRRARHQRQAKGGHDDFI